MWSYEIAQWFFCTGDIDPMSLQIAMIMTQWQTNLPNRCTSVANILFWIFTIWNSAPVTVRWAISMCARVVHSAVAVCWNAYAQLALSSYFVLEITITPPNNSNSLAQVFFLLFFGFFVCVRFFNSHIKIARAIINMKCIVRLQFSLILSMKRDHRKTKNAEMSAILLFGLY